MFTEIHMSLLPKIIAIAGGSGWATMAQIAGADVMQNQAVHVYGGWGVAVIGLGLLWKDNKALREEARQDREAYDKEREAREARADAKDEKHLLFTQECTDELRRLRSTHEARCYAHHFQQPPNPQIKDD